MARVSGSDKAFVWERRVGRFLGSGLTVARFCEQEGVSTASFYRWKKRLYGPSPAAGRRDVGRAGAGNGDGDAALFRPIRVTAAGTPISIRLPGGVRVEVPAENLDVVRAVLGELIRHDAML